MTEPQGPTPQRQVVQQRGASLLFRTFDDGDLAADRNACRALHVVTLGPSLAYLESATLTRTDGHTIHLHVDAMLTPGVPSLVMDAGQVAEVLHGPDQGVRIGRSSTESRNSLSIRVFHADGLHSFLVNVKRGTIGLTEHAFFSVDAVL